MVKWPFKKIKFKMAIKSGKGTRSPLATPTGLVRDGNATVTLTRHCYMDLKDIYTAMAWRTENLRGKGRSWSGNWGTEDVSP